MIGNMSRLTDAQIMARYAQIRTKGTTDASVAPLFAAVDELETRVRESSAPASPELVARFEAVRSLVRTTATRHAILKEELLNYINWLEAHGLRRPGNHAAVAAAAPSAAAPSAAASGPPIVIGQAPSLFDEVEFNSRGVVGNRTGANNALVAAASAMSGPRLVMGPAPRLLFNDEPAAAAEAGAGAAARGTMSNMRTMNIDRLKTRYAMPALRRKKELVSYAEATQAMLTRIRSLLSPAQRGRLTPEKILDLETQEMRFNSKLQLYTREIEEKDAILRLYSQRRDAAGGAGARRLRRTKRNRRH